MLAAGDAERYDGEPKHLIELEGERLLDRIVRQAREHGVSDVVVLGRDERYKVAGAKLVVPIRGRTKFHDSRLYWVDDTVLVYGDVWLSNWAADLIFAGEHSGVSLFARSGPADLTGCDWGECFAFRFDAGGRRAFRRAIVRVDGRMGGWEVFAMLGCPLVDINDWSEDFDYPEDVAEWVARRKIASDMAKTHEWARHVLS